MTNTRWLRSEVERLEAERDQARAVVAVQREALQRIIALDKRTERLGFAQGIARAALEMQRIPGCWNPDTGYPEQHFEPAWQALVALVDADPPLTSPVDTAPPTDALGQLQPLGYETRDERGPVGVFAPVIGICGCEDDEWCEVCAP